MLQLVNLSNDSTDNVGLLGNDPAKLTAFLQRNHLDGIEFMCCAPWDEKFHPAGVIRGMHLWFWPSWLDFWRGDEQALLEEFGCLENIETYFGTSREAWLAMLTKNFQQAAACGAEYAVFHVAQARGSEIRCRKFAYTSAQVIEAVLEFINQLAAHLPSELMLLYENLWWPGLDLQQPELVRELLAGTQHKAGIMLDTGHLMNTNTALRSEAEAVDYILKIIKNLGGLADAIRGIHLHASLSGEFAAAEQIRHPLRELNLSPQEMMDYVLQIDRHQPFQTGEARRILAAVQPEYLVHEFGQDSLEDWENKLRQQLQALQLG